MLFVFCGTVFLGIPPSVWRFSEFSVLASSLRVFQIRTLGRTRGGGLFGVSVCYLGGTAVRFFPARFSGDCPPLFPKFYPS